jgi:hypothetical protein
LQKKNYINNLLQTVAAFFAVVNGKRGGEKEIEMERQMVGRDGIGKRGKTEEEENKDEGGGYSMGENKNT